MYKQTIAVGALFLMMVSTASAAVIVRTADQLEVAEGVIDGGELLAVGLPVTLSNEVAEDATLVGNRVKVNGAVAGDVLAAGFFVDIDAPVSDDVRVVGGEVTIANEIAGDLIVLGGSVELLSTASVAGDVVVYGGTVDISGSVAGDVVGAMEFLNIKGAVGGGVDVRTVQLTLGQTASVTESVRYVSSNLVNQALNATVGGDVVRNDPVLEQQTSAWRQLVLLFLIGLFSTLVWYLCSRKSLVTVVHTTTQHALRSAVIGTATVFLAPFAIAILFISQLGAYVGAVCLFGFITLLLLGGAAAAAVVGKVLMQAFGQSSAVSPLAIVLGALALAACAFVPFVGFVVVCIAAIVSVGGIIESLVKANR